MKLNVNVLFISLAILIGGCSDKPCKIEDRTGSTAVVQGKPISNEKDLSPRIFVYKPDGTLQCGQGQRIDLSTMKKELVGIEVFSAQNKNDGLMRIQLCGHPTGDNNVFEIAAKDLEPALKLGFKKWIRD